MQDIDIQVEVESCTIAEMNQPTLDLQQPEVDTVESEPAPSPMCTARNCPNLKQRQPPLIEDMPPEPLVPVSSTAPIMASGIKRVILHVRDMFHTTTNRFGVMREYLGRPSYDPATLADLANFPTEPPSFCKPGDHDLPPPWPFENMSTFLLMSWYYSGSSQKTEQEVTRLVKDVIGSPEFKLEDLTNFNVHRENMRLDNSRITGTTETPFLNDGWREISAEIKVPLPKANVSSPKLSVPGLYYRPIIEAVKAAWVDGLSSQFHLVPFKKFHVNPDTGVKMRIFDEVYTSDAFENAHTELQRQRPEPGCKLERVVAGLMFWSDSTRLTHFGNVNVWPLYMYFANLSKYIRAKPNSGACHHIAYIPTVCLHM